MLPANRRPADLAAALNRPALLDRLLDHAVENDARHVRAALTAARGADVDGAQDGGLERRLVLLDVERDLEVGTRAAQRPDEPERDERGEHVTKIAMRNPVTDDGLNR